MLQFRLTSIPLTRSSTSCSCGCGGCGGDGGGGGGDGGGGGGGVDPLLTLGRSTVTAGAGGVSLVTAGEEGTEVGQELRLVIPGSLLVRRGIIMSERFTKCNNYSRDLQNRELGSETPEIIQLVEREREDRRLDLLC